MAEFEIDSVIESLDQLASLYCDRCENIDTCEYDGDPRECPDFKKKTA